MSKQSWKPGNMLYPVPAVMVSCKRPGEKANIITLAWAGTICSDPAMLSVSIRPERYSYDIIKETKEFVVNLVTNDLTRACDWCGVRSGKDYDKFKENKLTEFISEFMDTPAIEESPVNIYCKVKKIEKLGSHHMFIAEVVGVTVDEKYMDKKGRFDLKATNLMAYSHGEYFALGKQLGTFGYSVKKSTKKSKPGTKSGTKSGSKSGNNSSNKSGNKNGTKSGNKSRKKSDKKKH